ncbi:MAG: tRNA lysidine(34) synthetase TilS [Planctomycetia bacterium]|nr:tRNA lysidine(34) synthetase TilS [Planctomycetia bacterium]
MLLLEQQFSRQHPERWFDFTLLLAVSGGADSVAMLRLFHHWYRKITPQTRLIIAHANHGLRGEESDADEQFVRNLGASLGLPVVCERLDLASFSGGLEETARKARYAFLEKTALRVGARYIVTAHTQNDQVETILHRILRGTGLEGLAGMAPRRVLPSGLILLRPLLSTRREAILDYLQELQQPYRTDISNFSNDFTRNRIRQELLPLLQTSFNPQIEDALLRLRSIASETHVWVDAEMATWEERLSWENRADGSLRITLKRKDLEKIPPFLQKEFFRRIWSRGGFSQQKMGKREWDILAEMLRQESPPRLFPGNISVESGKTFLHIHVPRESSSSHSDENVWGRGIF